MVDLSLDHIAQEEKLISPSVEEISSGTPSTSLSISTNDRWFIQLPMIAARSQFTGRNIYLGVRHIQASLRPRNLVDRLTNIAPPKIDSLYKRWIVEE